MSRTGRPPLGPRAMTPAERTRAWRARQRARKIAADPQIADARAFTALAAGVLAANGGAVGQGEAAAAPPAPPPPPLPESQTDALVAIEAEVKTAFRSAMLDPNTPAQARIAAARSLAEMTGLLRTRTAPPDPRSLRQQEEADPATLARRAEETRQQIAELAALAAAVQGAAAMAEAAPWD